jgi:Putative peptidoglycan binding domain
MPENHTVSQGEHLSGIANRYGFSDYRLIYDHPQNAGLKQKRPDPNILLPGDEVFIPDKEGKLEPGHTEKRHRFKSITPKTHLRIFLKDEHGLPLSGEDYALEIEQGDDIRRYPGTTGEDGLVFEEIPAQARTANLILPKTGLAWKLRIGHLDPIEDGAGGTAIVSGLQARLNNLGFDCGPVDGVLGPGTAAALKRFQKAFLHRPEPEGTSDRETRDALVRHYGS